MRGLFQIAAIVCAIVCLPSCSKQRTDTHYAVSYLDDLGNRRQRWAPREEYRLGIALFPLTPRETPGQGAWLAHGLPLMLWVDLLQNIYVDPLDPARVEAKMKEMGFEVDRGAAPADGASIAESLGAPYFLTGAFSSDGIGIDLRVSLFRTGSPDPVGSTGGSWPSFFGAVDSVSVWLRALLPLEPGAQEQPDRPATEILTGSVEAMRVFSQGWWMNAREDDPGRTVERLDEALSLDPTFALAGLARYQAGRTLYSREARDRAFAEVHPYARRLPEPLRLAAEVTYDAPRNPERARRKLSLLLDLYPSKPLAQETAARAFLAWGEQEAAIAHFRRAVELYPWRERLVESVVGLYREAGREEEAKDLCRERVTRFPKNANARFLLGQLLSLEGRYPAARAELATALSIDPNHARALEWMGLVESRLGDLDASEENFRRSLGLSGPAARARIYQELAAACFDRGRVTRTFQVLEEGRADLASVEPVLAWRLDVVAGRYLSDLGNYSFALEKFRESPLSRNLEFAWIPELAEAAVLVVTGHIDQARSMVEATTQAIQDPTVEQAVQEMTLLGEIALAEGDLDGAFDRFSFVEALDPANRDNLLRIARTLRQMGRPSAADSVLSGARARFPNDPRLLSDLSISLEAEGRIADARSRLEEAVRLWREADPGIPYIEEARIRLELLSARPGS